MRLNNYKKSIPLDLGTLFFCLSIIFIFTNSNRGIVLAGGVLLILLAIVFWSFSAFRQFFYKENIILYLLVFLISVVLAGFNCIIKECIFEFGQFITFIIWGILFLLFVINVKTYFQFYQILQSCVISGLILSLFIIFQQNKYDLDLSRSSFSFMGQDMLDPNFLANFICLGLFMGCFLIIYQKKFQIFNILSVIFMLIAIFLTGSRAGFLYILISFFGMFCELYDNLRFNRRKILVLFIVTGILLITITAGLYKLKPDIFKRLFININAYIRDGSNQKRIQHWLLALKRITDAPFWGYGVTSEPLIMGDPVLNSSHNTFLSFYIRLGLPGTICFCLIIINIMHKAIINHQYFLMFIILGFIVNIIIIPATMSYVTWISLMMFYMLSKYMDFFNLIKI